MKERIIDANHKNQRTLQKIAGKGSIFIASPLHVANTFQCYEMIENIAFLP